MDIESCGLVSVKHFDQILASFIIEVGPVTIDKCLLQLQEADLSTFILINCVEPLLNHLYKCS